MMQNIPPIGTEPGKVDPLRRPVALHGRYGRTAVREPDRGGPAGPCGRRGRGRLVLLVGLAVSLGLAGFLALAGHRLGEDPEPLAAQVPGASPVAARAPAARVANDPGGAGVPRTSVVVDSLARPARDPRPGVERSFDGLGTLRGEVTTPPGVPFPSHWTLKIGPSLVLAGKKRAVNRTLEFSAGERMFHVPDIPLAGYSLVAKAADLSTRSHNVLLVEGRNDSFIVMRLEPAGFLDGSVFDEEGRPAQGLSVTLMDVASSRRHETTVDAAGGYLFPAVPDGEYRIAFGPPTSPLAPGRALSFRAPSMHFPKTTIPVTGTVVFMVQELDGRPVPDARLRGFGSRGGVIDTSAGYDGWARVHFLPPGRYRVNATSRLPNGTVDLKGQATFDLESTEPYSVHIHMRP